MLVAGLERSLRPVRLASAGPNTDPNQIPHVTRWAALERMLSCGEPPSHAIIVAHAFERLWCLLLSPPPNARRTLNTILHRTLI